MPSFQSDGVRIAYWDEGEGDPILLIHGFASNAGTNWADSGWVRTLVADGRRVIAFDNRGHGQSEKLYEPERYGAPTMAEDARALLDHLGIGLSEGTAIFVVADRFEVMGPAQVAVHDNQRKYQPWEKPYFVLSAGDVYNMKTRKIEKYGTGARGRGGDPGGE